MTADATAVLRRPKDRKDQILVHARDLFLALGDAGVPYSAVQHVYVGYVDKHSVCCQAARHGVGQS